VRRLAAAGLVTLSACSLLTDLNGFSGGSDANDGGPSAEGGTPPSGGDSGSSGGPADSAADAAGDAEAAAPQGCAAKPTASFCLDFDGTDPLVERSDRWDSVNSGVTLTNTAFSPPHATDIVVSTTNACTFATLGKRFDGTYTAGRVELMTRLEQVASFATITFDIDAQSGHNVIASLVGTTQPQLYVQKFTQPSTSVDIANKVGSLPASVLDTWVPIVVGFETTPTRRVYLRVAGQEIEDVIPDSVAFVTPRFYIGTWCEERLAHQQVDDVAIFVTP
jgi:hypothetical protein